MEKVEITLGQLSKVNPHLLNDIKAILQSSYVDMATLLKREDDRCQQTYYLREPNGELITFFMVNFEKLGDYKCAYLGLSGVSEKYKNTGLASLVYSKFIEEAQAYQNQIGEKIVLVATTCTPSAYNSVLKLWNNLNPKIDGTYDNYSLNIARLYCNKFNHTTKTHPFVLKAVAPNTFYSKMEVQRINRLKEKHDFKLFDELDICEKEGDRLLMIFELPKADNH